jgi:propanol-preferring alcohol dehydrogenase
MKAMILPRISDVEEKPLQLVDLPKPEPDSKEMLVKVSACGVCHTELDEITGRTPPPEFPIILGHEIVGRVEKKGNGASKFKIGDRVGVGWIHSACGRCSFCREGNENLCEKFLATGRDANGGYAEYTTVPEDFAYPIPEKFSDLEAAPLLCAGVVGYRALRLTNIKDGDTLGLFGFGASAHVIIQVAKYKYPNSKVYVFTREGQKEHQELARGLGADWVGATGEDPPQKLNCAIDFTPAWNPIVEAMKVMERDGRLTINAIRKEDRDKNSLLKLDYARDMWLEKEIKSVANVSRKDAVDFLPLAAEIPIHPKIQEFKLEEANEALLLLSQGKINGAGVLKLE